MVREQLLRCIGCLSFEVDVLRDRINKAKKEIEAEENEKDREEANELLEGLRVKKEEILLFFISKFADEIKILRKQIEKVKEIEKKWEEEFEKWKNIEKTCSKFGPLTPPEIAKQKKVTRKLYLTKNLLSVLKYELVDICDLLVFEISKESSTISDKRNYSLLLGLLLGQGCDKDPFDLAEILYGIFSKKPKVADAIFHLIETKRIYDEELKRNKQAAKKIALTPIEFPSTNEVDINKDEALAEESKNEQKKDSEVKESYPKKPCTNRTGRRDIKNGKSQKRKGKDGQPKGGNGKPSKELVLTSMNSKKFQP